MQKEIQQLQQANARIAMTLQERFDDLVRVKNVYFWYLTSRST